MEENEQNKNYFEINQFESSDIKNQPECFIDDDDPVFINNQIENIHNNTKKSHGSSIKTNATVAEDEYKENEIFSFFLDNNKNEEKFFLEEKKEMSKESIDILSNFILKEKNLISVNKNINIKNDNIMKDCKSYLLNINDKIHTYFKKPYMRKNIKKNNNKNFLSKNIYEPEDEKIKFDEKDDDIKTNNDSFEEAFLDKKKFQ